MQFEIQCSAIKEFDPTTQSYRQCGQKIIVDTTLVGTLVQCPSCENDVEVQNPSQLTSAPQTTSPDHRTPEQMPKSVPTAQPTDSSAQPISSAKAQPDSNPLLATGHKPDILSNTTISQTPTPNERFDTTSNLNPTAAPSPNLAAQFKTATSSSTKPVLQPASFAREATCHKCGTLLLVDQPKCPTCQTPRRAAFVKAEDRVIPRKRGPFGFQYHLDSIMNRTKENQSFFKFVGYAFIFLSIGFGSFLTIFGGLLGLFIGIPTAGAGILFALVNFYFEQMRKNPRMKLPAIGKFAWNITLTICRVTLFKKINEKQRLNKSNSEFGDQDIQSLRGINQFRLVDLESTSITDQSLLHFHNVLGIRYLVLKNTNVTEDAVHDLQQTIPKTWIWY